MTESSEASQLSDRESCLICLDRVLTLGKGYLSQHKDGTDNWVYGVSQSSQIFHPCKMNDRLANLLVELKWIEKYKWDEMVTIWKLSDLGYAQFGEDLC